LPSSLIVAISPYVTPPTKYTTTAGFGCELQVFVNYGMTVSPGINLRAFASILHPFLIACSTKRELNKAINTQSEYTHHRQKKYLEG
jgi:hypothetical protein